jgi:hypothetical protein
MARKYEGYANRGPGGGFISPRYAIRPDDEIVTAIDERDVEPVLKAARRVLKNPEEANFRNHLRAALKAFEDEEDSGGS